MKVMTTTILHIIFIGGVTVDVIHSHTSNKNHMLSDVVTSLNVEVVTNFVLLGASISKDGLFIIIYCLQNLE